MGRRSRSARFAALRRSRSRTARRFWRRSRSRPARRVAVAALSLRSARRVAVAALSLRSALRVAVAALPLALGSPRWGGAPARARFAALQLRRSRSRPVRRVAALSLALGSPLGAALPLALGSPLCGCGALAHARFAALGGAPARARADFTS